MLIVFADDFSGAAEIAGIANTHGHKTQIQKNFDPRPSCDVLIIDMNTRNAGTDKAKEITEKICRKLENSNPEIRFFKKIDSAFRGNIIPEIIEHQKYLNTEKILVLPTNPSIGRYIKDGQYWINGVLLHESSFAQDPDFPFNNSCIANLFSWKNPLPYRHLAINEPIPTEKYICTADISSTADIERLVAKLNPSDFLCGSGDTFRVFLKMHFLPKIKENTNIKPEYLLFINGSTHVNEEERDILNKNGLKIYFWQDLIEQKEQNLSVLIQNLLQHKKLAIFSTKNKDSGYDYNLESFGDFVFQLLNQINKPTHIFISGGATASAILHSAKLSTFEVIEELASGIVTLKSLTNNQLFITTKPGSYPWKAEILRKICKAIDPS